MKRSDAKRQRGMYAYRIARERLKAQRLPCWICGRAIDYNAHHTHPRSFTADHVIPLAAGGSLTDPNNLRAACRSCNCSRGASDGNRMRGQARRFIPVQPTAQPTPSRVW
jgi:5-methylcytosine-specific restriction endonuclease McrA